MLLSIFTEPRPTGPGVFTLANEVASRDLFCLNYLLKKVISLDAACVEDSHRSPLRDPCDE
jgi:hypothetical protein